MNFMENIQLKKSTLTKNELKACEKICEDLSVVQTHSIQELSDKIGIAKTTIMRFCQKVGYSGYSEFRFALINYVNSKTKEDSAENENRITAIEDMYADTIRLLHHTIQEENIREIADMIVKAGKLYLAGEVNSAVSAVQLYYSLLMYGIQAAVLDSPTAVHTVDLCAEKEDVLLLYSVSARSTIVKSVAELKENCSCKVILITNRAAAAQEEYADKCVVLPSLSAPHGSVLENVPVYSVFNEILLAYISAEIQKKENIPTK